MSTIPSEQSGYWSRVVGEKVFAHPFDHALFEANVERDAPVLHLGCGYGRLTDELFQGGVSSRHRSRHGGRHDRMRP